MRDKSLKIGLEPANLSRFDDY